MLIVLFGFFGLVRCGSKSRSVEGEWHMHVLVEEMDQGGGPESPAAPSAPARLVLMSERRRPKLARPG